MVAGKKVLTKGQIVSHFAGKFEISKKAAASMIEEYAALAIAETKKKRAFVLLSPAKDEPAPHRNADPLIGFPRTEPSPK